MGHDPTNLSPEGCSVREPKRSQADEMTGIPRYTVRIRYFWAYLESTDAGVEMRWQLEDKAVK